MDYLEITHPIVTALLTVSLAFMSYKFYRCSGANKRALNEVREEIGLLRKG